MDILFDVLRETWILMGQMSPYLLFGFLMAGVLHILVRQEFVETHLGAAGFKQILKATLIGVPMPLCSCGVIPVAASLRRSGAGKGATTAFLAATPTTGVDSVVVTYGLLGPVFAVARVVMAFVSGILTGVLVDELDPERGGEDGVQPAIEVCAVESPGRFRKVLEYGFISLPRDIGRALLIGLFVAGVIGAVIPASFFSERLGQGPLAILLVTAIAIPIYVCSTGSIPVAHAFMGAGLSPGTVLVFLIAGPATNAATVTTLWKIMGRRTVMIYLGSIIGSAWVGGWLFDRLPLMFDFGKMAGKHLPRVGLFNHVAASVLLFVLLFAMYGKRIFKGGLTMTKTKPSEPDIELEIQGMRCTHCSAGVTRALQGCPGVTNAEVDLDSGIAIITGAMLDRQCMKEEIEALGYTVKEEV